MDLLKARSVDQCIDIATTDAYDEDEVAMGWQNCLEEVFEEVDATLGGQGVKLEGFDTLSGAVLVRCRIN